MLWNINLNRNNLGLLNNNIILFYNILLLDERNYNKI